MGRVWARTRERGTPTVPQLRSAVRKGKRLVLLQVYSNSVINYETAQTSKEDFRWHLLKKYSVETANVETSPLQKILIFTKTINKTQTLTARWSSQSLVKLL